MQIGVNLVAEPFVKRQSMEALQATVGLVKISMAANSLADYSISVSIAFSVETHLEFFQNICVLRLVNYLDSVLFVLGLLISFLFLFLLLLFLIFLLVFVL